MEAMETERNARRFQPLVGSKSKVWKYFGFVTDDCGTIEKKDEVVCELCQQCVKYSKNTTNMLVHLKCHHVIQHNEIASKPSTSETSETSTRISKQTTFTSCLTKSEPYKKNSTRYKSCQDALVQFICLDLQPISVVSSPAFLKFINTMDPKYQPASRYQFSRAIIPSKYAEVKLGVESKLATAEYISVTTDMWTGCHQRGYMSLSAHYISIDWEMCHHCLQTREVSTSHNAENLAQELRQSLDEWGIYKKVLIVTTDNAANIRKAIVDEMSLTHLGCIGHTLQLSIGKALQLPPVARVLGRVRKLVDHFHKSTKATYELREKQERLELPNHELVQECKTRWGSTYMMLQRVQEQQPALCAVLIESTDRAIRFLLPDNPEWTLIEELMTILKPFHEATTMMSGSKYPTSSLLAPLLYKLLDVTLKVGNDDSNHMRLIKQVIATDLQTRYRSLSVTEMINTAAFLDPRFKDLDPFIPQENHDDIIEDVKRELFQVSANLSDDTDKEIESSNRCNNRRASCKKEKRSNMYIFC